MAKPYHLLLDFIVFVHFYGSKIAIKMQNTCRPLTRFNRCHPLITKSYFLGKKSKLRKRRQMKNYIKLVSIAASTALQNRLPYNLLSDKLFNKSMDSSHEDSIALYIALYITYRNSWNRLETKWLNSDSKALNVDIYVTYYIKPTVY